MWQETNPKNYQNFNEFQKRQRSEHPADEARPQPAIHVSADIPQWAQEAAQQAARQHVSEQPHDQDEVVEEVVVVGMKPMTVLSNLGVGSPMARPDLSGVKEWLSDHRFVAGLIAGFLVCFVILSVFSLDGLRKENLSLRVQNRALTEQVRQLGGEVKEEP